MVNRIKDRQTGEYHDIGGLKCKLVAVGETNNAEFGNVLLEKGKIYLIEINENSVLDSSATAILKVYEQENFISQTLITMLDVDSEQHNLCLINYNNGRLSFLPLIPHPSATYEDMALLNYEFKIYELPFALEV